MKAKVALLTVFVLGLQTAVFAASRGRAPRLPAGKVVVNVIDDVTMAAPQLEAVIDRAKRMGRREDAPVPRPGLHARRIIGARQYVLPDFSVELPPFETASLRGPKLRDSRVSLAVTSMQSLAQRGPGVRPTETDLTLTAVVTQKRGQHGVITSIAANRRAGVFGDVLHTTVTPELQRRLPRGPSHTQMFVGVVRTVLIESLPKALRVVKR